MVDAYATSLGSLTLAVDAGHFILEDSVSNSVLSLHPAIRFEGAAKPQVLSHVEGFSTSSGCMSVTWKTEEGLEAVSTLSLEDTPRFRLEFRVTNSGKRPLTVDCLCPVFVPPEGPGACALGMHDLRTVVLPQGGGAPRLHRVHGGMISNSPFGAWFSDSGQPMLLLAALPGPSPKPLFLVEGARGKILHLSVECPAGGISLAPGESISAVPLRLVIGNYPVKDVLLEWAAGWQDSTVASCLKDFDPTGALSEPEAEAVMTAADSRASEENPAAPDTVQPSAPTPKEENPSREDREIADPSGGAAWSLGRCALFRRALRANEGIWPRWAAGRKYAPLKSASIRGRA
jgi:hypothetical protein